MVAWLPGWGIPKPHPKKIVREAVATRTPQAEGINTAPSPGAPSSSDAGASADQSVWERLGDKMLHNAASLRNVRGQTTCLRCQGGGQLACPVCQGEGVHHGPVRMNQMRRAGSKLKVLMGLEGPLAADDDWLRTNRCRRCHGTGVCTCPVCRGEGTLGP